MRVSTFRNTQQVNTQSVNKQKGFTLIELVVVIVILGILAVTAAPKFIDLTSDAKGAVLQAVKASVNSAADLVHAKALVQSQVGPTGAVSAANANITLVHGWPDADSIASLLELEANSPIVQVSGSNGTFTHEDAATEATCVTFYDVSGVDETTRPVVTTTVTGC